MSAIESEEVWHKTACILCENNCGLKVTVDGRSIDKIRGDKAHPNSQGYTCEKALRLDKYQSNRNRLTSPMRRNADGTYDEIDWDTAISEIATKLGAIRDEHGGDKIFYYAGGGQGNHIGGAYGRGLIHALGAVFYSNALAQEKVGEGWVDMEMYGSHTTGDFENSEVALFVGKNPWQSHGVARARTVLREIARDPDRAIIVIDPRRSDTAEHAEIHLQVKPGTDAWCISAILGTLVSEDLIDRAWLAEHAVGIDEVLATLADIDIAECARKCGVDEDLIRLAARRIARAESFASYEDIGVQQGPNSTVVSYLNKLQWILTGNFAKPGGVHMHSWLFPIAGNWHHVPPARPKSLLDRRRVIGEQAMRRSAGMMRKIVGAADGSAAARAIADRSAGVALDAFFDAVSVPLATHIAKTINMHNGPDTTYVTGAPVVAGLVQGTTITEEILTDHPDRLRAMWVDASNPVHSLPDSKRMREAFAKLDLTVVVDVAMTETGRCADYVLPAASQFEKWEGSLFTLHFPHNMYQARGPLMDPTPGTRSEPEIYAAVIDELGVVDQQLLDDLSAAARVGRKAFALAFFSTVAARPELAGLLPYLLYKTLGPTLPEGQRSLAIVWGMAHLCAIGYPDAVSRAGHRGRGFDLGESLFEAIRTTREGVVITDDAYEDAWGYIHHDDGRIHAHIPILLEELEQILAAEPHYTTKEFPLTLSAGERRAFTANVIYRDPEWRKKDRAGALRISPADADSLGLETGDAVRVVTENGEAPATVEVNDIMQTGHISLPNGFGLREPDERGEHVRVGTPPNELTGITRRDKFFLTPWHKNVPARVEPSISTTTPPI